MPKRMLPKVTTRKWEGDDEYSWAVFRSDQHAPVYRGCSRMESTYYKRITEERIEEEEPRRWKG